MKGKVLIVDDEAPIRIFLSRVMRLLGLGLEDILFAANGKEALEKVHEEPSLRLVLLDLKMPQMDGTDAFEEIRKFCPNAKIVILTGYPHYRDTFEKLKVLHPFQLLTKPVDLDYLETIISNALREDE